MLCLLVQDDIRPAKKAVDFVSAPEIALASNSASFRVKRGSGQIWIMWIQPLEERYWRSATH